MNYPFISIIIPVKNEEMVIEKCLQSLKQLDYPINKFEVIIVDGLSADKTVEIAKNYKAKVITNHLQTVAPGRNLGFLETKGELIAFSDADCVMDKNWLKNSLQYFQDKNVGGVGGPNFIPKNGSAFNQAVDLLLNLGSILSNSVHVVNLKTVKPVQSLPGCNAIYRKEALKKVMPIDEGLLTCEDAEMNYRLSQKGYKLLYTPDVFVWHHRRDYPKKFWKQIYRYAIGRLQLSKKYPRTINLTHFLFGLSIPIFIGLILITILFNFSYLLIALGLIVASITVILLGLSWARYKSILVGLDALLVMLIFTLAWSLGFLRELFLPIKNVKGK